MVRQETGHLLLLCFGVIKEYHGKSPTSRWKSDTASALHTCPIFFPSRTRRRTVEGVQTWMNTESFAVGVYHIVCSLEAHIKLGAGSIMRSSTSGIDPHSFDTTLIGNLAY